MSISPNVFRTGKKYRLVNFGDQEVAIGTAVEVVIEEVEPGLRLAFFQPSKGA